MREEFSFTGGRFPLSCVLTGSSSFASTGFACTGPRPGTRQDSATVERKKRILNFLNVHGQLDRARREAKGIPHNWLMTARRNDPDFESQIQETIQLVKQRKREKLEEELFKLASEGHQRPVYQRGILVGHENTKHDLLLMFQLKQLDPSYRDNPKINIDQRTHIQQKSVTVRLNDEQLKAVHQLMEIIEAQVEPRPKMLSASTDISKDSVLIQRGPLCSR